MRFHENYQAVQAPVCELHEQRRLASLGTHHQGSSPALTPTLGSLRRKREARGRKSHTEWPKNTKCEKATGELSWPKYTERERERVQIGMAHGLIRNYRAKLCRTTAPTSSPWPGQLRRWSDRCPSCEFESVKRVESCGACLETLSLTSRDWTVCWCGTTEHCGAVLWGIMTSVSPRPRSQHANLGAKRHWHKQENRQMCRKCLVFLWQWKDQGTKHFSWICLLTDWVYEVLYCDGSK